MVGKVDKATDLMQKLQGFTGKKTQLDPIVKRQAKRYIAGGPTFAAFELLYLRRDLAKMNSVMTEVLKSLEEMASKTGGALIKKVISRERVSTSSKIAKGVGSSLAKLSPFAKKNTNVDYSFDERAAYLLLKGSMLKSLDPKSKDAIDLFLEATELQDNLVEKLYAPYVFYELGESFFAQGDLEKAEEYMKKCSKCSGYDWEDPLRIRLRVTMEQLKKSRMSPEEKNKILSLSENTKEGEDKDDDIKEEDLKEEDLKESGEIEKDE